MSPVATGRGGEVSLGVEIAGLKLKNPVITASGTCGYGTEFQRIYDVGRLGAVVTKAVSLKPRPGNPAPRMIERAAAMLSSCGLQNVGLEAFLRDKAPLLRDLGTTVICNIAGESVEEFEELAGRLDACPEVAALELNLSCPNVKTGGMSFGVDPKAVQGITQRVKAVTTKPVISKLTPNVTDIVEVAKAAEAGGADAVSLINALLGMAIDVHARRPYMANVMGGLTGPAIRPVAVRMVWQVANQVDVPVIGMGGICCAEDALEFLLAGAAAVQVGTANLVSPLAPLEIIDGIRAYLAQEGFASVQEVQGKLGPAPRYELL